MARNLSLCIIDVSTPSVPVVVGAYDTPDQTVRAFYQVLTTTSARGYLETFMGDEGTLQISEDPTKCRVFAEGYLPKDAWDKWAEKGYLARMPPPKEEPKEAMDAIVSVYKSLPPVAWLLPVELEKSYHQPHLENFCDPIRHGAPLNCPADVGYDDLLGRGVVGARTQSAVQEDSRKGGNRRA